MGCQRCSEEGKCLQCHESFSLSADSQCSAASSGNSGSIVAIISELVQNDSESSAARRLIQVFPLVGGAVVGVVLVFAVGAAVVCIMMWLCVWRMKKTKVVEVNKRTEEVFYLLLVVSVYS